jgi:hypothetical protein
MSYDPSSNLEVFNVKTYGAVGDGSHNDTTAIQAAITAAGALDGSGNNRNGVVFFPPLPYGDFYLVTSTLQVAITVQLLGAGWFQGDNVTFGTGNYTGSNVSGSVIKSTVTSNPAIFCQGSVSTAQSGSPDYGLPAAPGGHTGAFNIQNLCLLGPGSGSSTGIAIGEGASFNVDGYVENVQVCNFDIGWAINGVENSVFMNWAARGCNTGVAVGGAGTNACVFIDTEVNWATVSAITVNGSLGNKWAGISMQQCSGTSYLTTSGISNAYDTCYMNTTDVAPPSWAIQQTGNGSHNEFRNWYGADSNGINIEVVNPGDGGNGNIFSNIGGSSVTVTIPSGTYNIIENIQMPTAGTFDGVTGAGAGNCMVFDPHSGIISGTGGFYGPSSSISSNPL